MPKATYYGPHFFFSSVAKGATSSSKGTFVDYGKINKAVIRGDGDAREVLAPYPNVLKRIGVVGTRRVTDFTLTFVEASPLHFIAAFGTAWFDGGTAVQFNPNEGDGLVRGWAKLQLYDGDWVTGANPTAVIDMWSVLKCSELDLSNDLVNAVVEGMVIENTLNTGSLTLT